MEFAASGAPGALLAGLPLDTFDFDIAGRRWRIRAVADQSRLLAASDSFDRFPFGLLLWESAPVLAQAVAALGAGLGHSRVLELGAGAGLAGLVAAHLGARVRQTDHAEAALDLARLNAGANGVAVAEVATADWHQWTDTDRYDLVIGSDVLYEREAHEPIAAILDRNLATGGRALLTDPGRQDTPLFIALMVERGWRVTQTVNETDALSPGDGRPRRIAITLMELQGPPAQSHEQV